LGSLSAEPPAISGGTLLVLADGVTAVAADPDRDRVSIVDLQQLSVVNVPLQAGDEPGRVVEDAAGHVHVALRRGGALVSIDPKTGAVLARRAACASPRGVAYDSAADVVYVACADGPLVTFPAAGGAATRAVMLDDDLRDVVVQPGALYVSRFRSAEVLVVAADGSIAKRITFPSNMGFGPMGATTMAPAVAWRMVGLAGGGLLVLHQRGQVEEVSTQPGGYAGGMCPGSGIVEDTLTIVKPGTTPVAGPPLGMVTLAVDVAASPDGSMVTVAAPGSIMGMTVAGFSAPMLDMPGAPCALPDGPSVPGQATAVAYDGQGHIVAQVREPAQLVLEGGTTIPLGGASAASDGHSTFHTATQGGIACGSCHPEGGDDGRVWQFSGLGSRRTQNLRGGVLARTPFHWSGDIPNMDTLVQVVLVGRMGGQPLSEDSIANLGAWMNAQPVLQAPAPADPAAVQKGEQIFNDASVGCNGCHNGPQLSNHALVDVGTGGTFKVPSLVAVRYRAPYLHTGCGSTLEERFDPTCGGGESHGHTAQLSQEQIGDLIAYLESL
jgi:cytochrome c553